MTILGTRPEIIRLSRIIALLDQHSDHQLVHTGQNFTQSLSDVFFEEMGVRSPDRHFDIRSDSFGDQIGQVLVNSERAIHDFQPDRLLILGDTNSGLSAIVAKRLGVPVFHMEAGNRCYDDRVPEEVNRRIIDHSSSILLPYTQRSRENLLAEGISGNRIYVTGNPIKEVIDHYSTEIDDSTSLEDHGVQPEQYFLVTLHRAENVDDETRLRSFIGGLVLLGSTFDLPIICSLHPRTRSKIEAFDIDVDRSHIKFIDPVGFFDFVRLEQSAFCLLSDSGTVQEEASLFGRPNVTLRDVTERPETLDCGSNLLCGSEPDEIVDAVRMATSLSGKWKPPSDYLVDNVSETVVRIILSRYTPNTAEAMWLAAPKRQGHGTASEHSTTGR